MPDIRFKIGARVRTSFDGRSVLHATNQQKRSVLMRFAAFVMRRARNSIRPSRQLQIGEMTADQLLVYRIRQSAARRHGHPQPKRPLASSRPGEAPRSILGYLRRFLLFAWDPATSSVVIGPSLFASGTAPRNLEEGGKVVTYRGRSITIQPRPFMRPAFEAELPGIPALWQRAAAGFGGAA